MIRRITVPALLALFVAVQPAAAQRPASAERPRAGGTLVVVGASDLQGMNSLVAVESYTTGVINELLFLPLVRLSPRMEYVPALAREWTLSGDTAVTFRLRRGVRWHDGAPTTAYDVAFTFARIKDAETAFPDADDFARWESVEVVDSYTVRFRLSPHVEPLMAWTQTAVMPRHLLDSIPSARMRQAAFNVAPVGNGPFRFVSYQANDRWVFEANPDYPRELGGRPHLDRIVWRVVPENAARVAEARTGQGDVVLGPGADQLKTLDELRELRALVVPSRRYLIMPWNGLRAPFSDARVRRALTLAINRPLMRDVLRGGFADLAAGPVAPYHWAYDTSVAPLPYDTAAARALLRDAGYADRDGDGQLDAADGKALKVELKIPANSSFNRNLGEMIQADLARIGVQVTLRATDFATLIQDISSADRNFDAALLNFETDFRLSLRDAFHSEALGGPFQSASYSNPAVDRILDRTATTFDRRAARALWSELQAILREDQPWTFFWFAPDLLVANERVRGLNPDIRGLFAGARDWWIER